MSNSRSVTLTPSWKAFFWPYVLGVLLFPVIIGIIILWKTITRHRSISYVLGEKQIQVIEHNIHHTIDLANINDTRIKNSAFGVATIEIDTGGRQVELLGIENAEGIKEAIDTAVAQEIARMKELEKQKNSEQVKKPGRMDRLDYLTGLWQQGLLSDEDYQKERKNFE